jgi:hypothetical protein
MSWEIYNICIASGVQMELVRLIDMCLNETNISVPTNKHSSDSFLIKNYLKEGDILTSLLSTLLWNMPLGRSMKLRKV